MQLQSPIRNHVTRGPEPVRFECLRIATLLDLKDRIESENFSLSIVSDLSLGAWKGSQVYNEFCCQLNLMPEQIDQRLSKKPFSSQTATASNADMISLFVDSEGAGDQSILRALHSVNRMLDFLHSQPPCLFYVIAPRFGAEWENDNLLFLRLFQKGIHETQSRFRLVAFGGTELNLPDDCTVTWLNDKAELSSHREAGLGALVPGIIPKRELERLSPALQNDQYLPLANGYTLIAPECRIALSTVPPPKFSRLLQNVSQPWLKAFAQIHGNRVDIHAPFLYGEAWNRYEEGGYGIALRIIERAMNRGRSEYEQAFGQMQAQCMRIALQRFREAASIPPPSANLPLWIRGVLFQGIAWGYVMINQAERAEEYFQVAREILKTDTYNDEYLYLLNISALNRFKLKDLSGAMAFEKEIEEKLNASEKKNWHLVYFNCMNIARIYREWGQWQEAEKYFLRGFETTLGCRSESDLVYTNVLLSKLYTKWGKYELAYTHWLRAAIHWLSASAPEGLTLRVLRAIVGKAWNAKENVVEQVSQALASELIRLAELADIHDLLPTDLNGLDENIPDFVRLDVFLHSQVQPRFSCAVLGNGWSALRSDQSVIPSFRGRNWNILKYIVHRIFLRDNQGCLPENQCTYVIDDQFGCEMPLNLDDLLGSMIRNKICRVMIQGREEEYGEDDLLNIMLKSRIEFASSVSEIVLIEDAVEVKFKRYFPPKMITVLDAAILHSIENGVILDRLYKENHPRSKEDILSSIRIMERDRILQLRSESVQKMEKCL